MGNFRDCRFVILFAAFLLIAFPALAETIPATQSNDTVKRYYIGGQQPYAGFASMQESCDAFGGTFSAPSSCGRDVGKPWQSFYTISSAWVCPTDYSKPSCITYSCPDSSWKLVGNMCEKISCPSGTTWNEISQTCRCDNGSDVGDNGSCCPQSNEAIALMQKCLVFSTTATSCNSSDSNGCAIRCNNVTFQKPVGAGGDSLVINDGLLALGQMCKYTGSKANNIDRLGSNLENEEHGEVDDATKPPPTPKKPENCLAAGMGYVQSSTGSTTCVPSGKGGDVVNNSKGGSTEGGKDSNGNPIPGKNTETQKSESKGPNGQTTSKEVSTTTNPDGSTTTTTRETKCNGSDCVTTEKVENKDSNGNSTGSTEKNQNETKDDFCTKNPNDVACRKNDSKFSGGCESGFVCEGDAATCAIAQASWRLTCDGQKRSELNDIGESVISGTDGKRVSDIPTSMFNIPGLGADSGAVACPSLPPLPGGLSVDMSQHCGILQGLGNAGVALALLMAGFIIIGGVRGL